MSSFLGGEMSDISNLRQIEGWLSDQSVEKSYYQRSRSELQRISNIQDAVVATVSLEKLGIWLRRSGLLRLGRWDSDGDREIVHATICWALSAAVQVCAYRQNSSPRKLPTCTSDTVLDAYLGWLSLGDHNSAKRFAEWFAAASTEKAIMWSSASQVDALVWHLADCQGVDKTIVKMPLGGYASIVSAISSGRSEFERGLSEARKFRQELMRADTVLSDDDFKLFPVELLAIVRLRETLTGNDDIDLLSDYRILPKAHQSRLYPWMEEIVDRVGRICGMSEIVIWSDSE